MRLETLPNDILFEITVYLDPDHLPCLCLLSNTMKTFYDCYLKLILMEKVKTSGHDLKSFDISELFHLCRVIRVPHQLCGHYFITNWGQVYDLEKTHHHHHQPKPIMALIDERVIQVSVSDIYTLFLLDTWKVYVIYNQQGEKEPTLIEDLVHLKIIQVSAGNHQALFLTAEGQVYVCNGNNQQLELITSLTQMKIIQISAGENHSLFLTSTGQVYTSGYNLCGQLGVGDRENRDQPVLINALSDTKIIQMSAGVHYSLFLTKTYQIYICGCLYDDTSYQPILITPFDHPEILQISAGFDHSLFLTKTNQVYACGEGFAGQLGLGDKHEREQPELITTLRKLKIVEVFAGDYYSLFLTDIGQIYSCGHDAWFLDSSQQANNNQYEPVLVPGLNYLNK